MAKATQRLMTWSVALAMAGGSGAACASAFQLMEQNASGLGNAYAGQGASAQDASTVFWNPAGMTKLPGKNVVGAVNAIRPSTKFSNTGSTNAPLQPFTGDNGGDAGDWAFVPNAYFTWQVMPQLWVGLGLNAPFGLKTEYDQNWVGRFHGVESELKTINVNPSVAWKVNDMFSIGAGINYQRAEATLSNFVNYSAAAGGALGAGLQGLATVDGDDDAWGWNAGAMIDLTPATRIGLAYRSSVKYTITGSVNFQNRPAALGAAIPDGPVKADIKLPSIASLSLFHKLNPKWDLLADVSWTDWSTLQSLDIYRTTTGARLSTTPLNWKDSWRVGIGANWHYNDMWTFRFGLAYDQSPVQDAERTPRVPDQDRTWLAFGAQYRVSKQLAFDVGYAYIFVKDASSDLCNPGQAAGNPAACAGKNRLVGNYEANVNIISAQIRYAF